MSDLKGGQSTEDPRLDRLVPPDWTHVEKYPIRTLAPEAVASVERQLLLPRYKVEYDQGSEGACVGYGSSWAMSILNHRLYVPRWLYWEAQKVDPWPGGSYPGADPVYDGTLVRDAMDVLATQGHVRLYNGEELPPDKGQGIKSYRWATTVDEIRTSIASGVPVVLGINWYSNFDHPEGGGPVHWIGRGDLGTLRGGHCICCFGASDKRSMVKLVNSWGKDYPNVQMPYETLERLLGEDGEACIVTDA